jgi:lytic murein transglycosylase
VQEPSAPVTQPQQNQEQAAQPPVLEPAPQQAAQPPAAELAPADDAATQPPQEPAAPAEDQAAQSPVPEPQQEQAQPGEGEAPAAAPQKQATPLPAFAPTESREETTAALAPPPPAKRAPYPPPNEGCRNTESFPVWLARFKKDAAAAGIRAQTINSVLAGAGIDSKVIARDRGQKFFAQSFLDFQQKLATQNRVVSGRKKIAEHKATFERAQKQFGVPPSVITGFWALESDFGAGMGKFPIMPSLVTLAYDCRRQVMFQEELKAALQIIDRGDLHPGEMIGSWAGEIGQTQFLPTRYLDHAIDFDGDGRIDLFRDENDVIGTTANYMHHLGWRPNEPWLEEVRITKELPWQQADLAIKLPRSQWAAWGITYPNGQPVPNDKMPASLLLPMGRFGPAFLAYPNFDIYTEWNNSLTYATTAAYLATRIDGAGPMGRGRGPIPELDQAGTKELQQILANRGYDVGKIDGLAGSKTRAAVKDMQLKLKLPPDSYPTPELLEALRSGG